MGDKLFYFTDSYPYGFGQTWKTNELAILRDHFESITVIPYCAGGDPQRRVAVPDGVGVMPPLFDDPTVLHPRELLLAVREGGLFRIGGEFLRARGWIARQRADKWLTASTRIQQLRHHPTMGELIRRSDERTVWYFYWGRGSCDIVPFLNGCTRLKTFVRMHRYDLFEDRNDGYIPYRRALLDTVDIAAPSSKAGVEHLRQHYPRTRATIAHVPCGTRALGPAPASGDGTFRLVSCSSLVPRKRVDVLIDALREMTGRVLWTHLGDGPEASQLHASAASLPSNVEAEFLGHVDPDEVLPYYCSRPVDLFINMSSSEGVPFSIMEALSAGIPVLATAVGGTPEIVDDRVGTLLPENVSAEELRTAICAFRDLDREGQQQRRDAARQRHSERCDVVQLTHKLAHVLTSRLHEEHEILSEARLAASGGPRR